MSVRARKRNRPDGFSQLIRTLKGGSARERAYPSLTGTWRGFQNLFYPSAGLLPPFTGSWLEEISALATYPYPGTRRDYHQAPPLTGRGEAPTRPSESARAGLTTPK